MARATTGPTLAPTPCTKRAATSIASDVLPAQISPASVKSASPASSTGRRPQRSESGPQTICPSANPTRKKLSVNAQGFRSINSIVISPNISGGRRSCEREVRTTSSHPSFVCELLTSDEFIVPEEASGALGDTEKFLLADSAAAFDELLGGESRQL